METKQINLDQLMEVSEILSKIDIIERDLIMRHIINLNSSVIDYENRIKNAISQLSR